MCNSCVRTWLVRYLRIAWLRLPRQNDPLVSAETILAIIASSFGVVMGASPVSPLGRAADHQLGGEDDRGLANLLARE